MTHVSEVLEWHGRTVVATDGDKLGKVEEIYFDQETDRPEWALVNTGMFAGKSSFMPLEGATSDGEQVTAPYTKDQVKDAPKIDPDGALSQPEEAELYRHYGVDYGESRSGSGLPETSPGNGEQGDACVVDDDCSGGLKCCGSPIGVVSCTEPAGGGCPLTP